jgi:predicted Zn-dependent peptidase
MNAPEPREISRAVLPNGMVVITEPMPHLRSISVGIWLRNGSRAESAQHSGIAHFIEHMVFKGTEKRSAEEIAREVDSIGGLMDAYTAKEMVSFNAKVLDEHLPIVWDVLSDLVLRPLFDKEEIKREKQVVLEEIKMDQDNPEYLVHEMLTQNFWRDHPLGQPILGTPETVGEFSRASISEAFRKWYAPNHLIITAAGHIEHRQLLDLASAAFAALKPSPNGAVNHAPKAHPALASLSKRELEQAHVCVGTPSVALSDDRRFAAAILNTILGGGMSSRLFQNIRERQGLAYAVFSELNPYSDTGMLTIYAGVALSNVEKVLAAIAKELRALKDAAVSADELRRAKDHLKGSLMLSLESTSARMSNLARQEMYFGRFFTLDEVLASIEAVTREEVSDFAREFFQPEKIAATVVGNLKDFELRREHLAC